MTLPAATDREEQMLAVGRSIEDATAIDNSGTRIEAPLRAACPHNPITE